MNRIVTKWVAGAAVGLLCWSQGPRTGLAVALAQTGSTPSPTPAPAPTQAPTPVQTPAATPTAAPQAPAPAAAPAAQDPAAAPAPQEAPAAAPVEPAPPAAPVEATAATPTAAQVLDTGATEHKKSMTAVWITGGVSVAAFATGIGFAIDAVSKNASYNDKPNGETAKSGEQSAFAADLAFGLSALSGVTALALWLLDDSPAPVAAAAPPAPAPEPAPASTPAPAAEPAPAAPPPPAPGPTSSLSLSRDAAARSIAASKVRWTATPVAYPQGGGLGAVVKF